MQRTGVERDGGDGENADVGSACDCNLKDGSDDEPREMNHWVINHASLPFERFRDDGDFVVRNSRVGGPESIDCVKVKVNEETKGSRAGSVPGDLVG
jgi:hypothetical protein